MSDMSEDEIAALEEQLEAEARERDEQIDLQRFRADRLARVIERDRQIDEMAEKAASVPRAQVLDLAEMLDRYAYLRNEDRIVDLEQPWFSYTPQGFARLHAASTRLIVGPRGGERAVPIVRDWEQHDGRITLAGMTFVPRAPRITENVHGQLCCNLWSKPAIEQVELPKDWAERAALFEAHMEHLIPDKQERDYVVKWLAHRVQRPEVLPGWHPLLIAEGKQGTGRGWVGRLMKAMLGKVCVEALPLTKLLESDFNSILENAVLAFVEEVREGGKEQWKHTEALKSMLTEKTRVINKKFRPEWECGNFCGFLLCSNHLDALPLEDDDRRVLPIECTQEEKPAAYFDRIYDALKDKVVLRCIYERLMQEPLDGFPIEARAPRTGYKAEVVEAARMDEETELRRLIREWPTDLIRSSLLRKLLQDFRDDDPMIGEERPKVDQLTKGQLRRLYRVCGAQAIGPRRLPGPDGKLYNYRVVALRNRKHWKAEDRDPEEIRKQVLQGELLQKELDEAALAAATAPEIVNDKGGRDVRH